MNAELLASAGLLDLFDDAFDARDGWALVTAAAAAHRGFFEDADRTVATIVDRTALEPGRTVFDVGAGVGRHLAAFARRGFTVGGLERSPILARVANSLLGDAVVTEADFRELPDLGGPATYLLMSDTLSLFGAAAEARAALQALRLHMWDGSFFVVEVSAASVWPTAGERSWGDVGSVRLTDTVTRQARVAGHTFRFARGVEHFELTGPQHLWSVDDVCDLLESAGFRVELTVDEVDGPSGSTDVLVVATAAKSWNFLSDLDDFLEAWHDPTHARNDRQPQLHHTSDGRITSGSNAAPGRGDSLTRHHADFRQAIEPMIRSLVFELIDGWDQIAYSSCEGHVLEGLTSHRIGSDAYVGLVALDDEHVERLRRLLERATRGLGAHTQPEIRERRLHGVGGWVSAVDIVLRRTPGAAWSDYRVGLQHDVRRITDTLQEIRVRGRD